MKFSSPTLFSLTAVLNSVKGWELGKVTISGNEFVQHNVEKHGTTDTKYFNLADDGSIFRRLNSMKLNKRTALGRINCQNTTVYDSSGNFKFNSKILIFGDQNQEEAGGKGKGPRNIGRMDPPDTDPSKIFAIDDYFTISLNDIQYPILDYQDYSIEEPVVELLDGEGSGNFTIDLAYPVGAFADDIQVTLYNKTCDEEVSGDEQVIALGSKEKYFNSSHPFERYVQQVSINSKYFSESDLLTWGGFGESSGTLTFCAKAETLLGSSDGVSVAFVKSDISVSFNLTDNTFNVFENKISSNDIITSEQNITTEYGVEACTCTVSPDVCHNEAPIFEQNGLINVCVYPDSKSSSSTQISNFDMKFVQDGEDVYTAVTITPDGPASTSLSNIGGTSDRYRVASRLITALFEGGKTSFNITGNAFLTFKTSRYLKTMQRSNLRSMQEASIRKDAGKSQFQMSVKIVKGKVSSRESNTMGGVVVSIVGGFIALSIVFVVFKKMKK